MTIGGSFGAEWQREGLRSVGIPKHCWKNDIVGQQGTQGTIWTKTAKDRECGRLWCMATFCSERTQSRME